MVQKVANILIQKGMGPERLAAICLDRKPELVVAILAVLEIGGGFLPLDPQYPQARLTVMLQDAGPDFFLGDADFAKRIGPMEAEVVDVESILAQPATSSEVALPPRLENALACVTYTSGSTGRPKGVGLSHANITSYLEAIETSLNLQPSDVYLHTASFSFIASIRPLLVPLLNGATVVLATFDDILDPLKLWELIARTKVTVIDVVSSYLHRLLDTFEQNPHLGPDASEYLRTVTFTGEPMPAQVPTRFWRLMGQDVRLLNLYGQTELTSTVAVLELRREALSRATTVQVGTPAGMARLHLFREGLEPAGVGEEGQLFSGGPALARGYLGQPRLTAEKFIPDPYGKSPGSRLFSTGDVGRSDEEGLITLIGRTDQLIKIRGQRVEPGEVEAVLRRHQSVTQAAVIAIKDEAGNNQLHAFAVPRSNLPTDSAALHAYLTASLPRFMVPGALHVIEAMPFTPSGKIDRKALAALKPKPDHRRADQKPATALEAEIHGIWAEILGTGEFGIDRNFFELGGHSLMASQIVNRINARWETTFSIRDFFNHPTITAICDWLGSPEPKHATPASEPYRAPVLSFAQERLWFIHHLMPDQPLYQIAMTLELEGDLNRNAAREAWRRLVMRHAPLRTVFHTRDGAPEAIVLGAPEFEWHFENAHPDNTTLDAEIGRPFDLTRGPLLRVLLQRHAPNRHTMKVIVHHVAADGWSLGIMLREWGSLYLASATQDDAHLQPPASDYTTFANRQRSDMAQEKMARSLKFWVDTLTGTPTLLELPADFPNRSDSAYRGAYEPITIPRDLRQRMHQLGQRHQATLFMTLLAAFQAWLHLYADRDHFAVGSPVAGRDQPEWEELIGCFVNLLPLTADFRDNPTFDALLARTREAVPTALAHGDCPFDKLVEALQPERAHGGNPICQTAFVLQNAPLEAQTAGDLTITPSFIDPGTSQFDLVLSLSERDNNLAGVFKYNQSLFKPATVRRMASSFIFLLEALTNRPDQPIASFGLMPAKTHARLATAWNRSSVQVPGSFLQQFHAAVAKAPEHLAAVLGHQTLTYAQLDRRSSRLAAILRQKGIRPGDPVGVLMTRTPDLMVCFLAILKAHGVYLPLDPDLPPQRLRWIAENAGAKLSIHHRSSQPPPELANLQWCNYQHLDLETGIGEFEATDHHPDQRAYIIYTSGSTGKPKGAVISHRALANVAHCLKRVLEIQPGDHIQQASAIGFDASIIDLAMTLAAGATLYCTGAEELLVGNTLAQALRERAIQSLFVTPSMLEGIDPAGFPALKSIFIGGELPPRGLMAAWARHARVYNIYGPTEATVWACTTLCNDSDPEPPVGRPVDNASIYLANRHLQPVLPGLPGEVLIGGSGLAQGYLDRPGMTAAKFVPNPFGNEPGTRLYRSGDLGIRLEDGQVQYAGRIDHQVKLRGFRIELGEIEQCLATQSHVVAAAVLMRHSQDGDPYLAAFLELDDANSLDEVRLALAERLPHYMIPAKWVVLDTMPRFTSGKTNRGALPQADRETTVQTPTPANPHDEIVARIWAKVLNRDRIRMEDNFFEQGGHSLSAVRITGAIRDMLGIDLPIKSLFEAPVLAQFTAFLARRSQPHAEREIALVPGMASTPAPLSASQQRLWFICKLLADQAVYNLPIVLHLHGDLDREALSKTMTELLHRHPALRTAFPTVDGSPVQQVQPVAGEPIALDDVCAAEAPKAAAFARATALIRTPFNLEHGPLMRSNLVCFGALDNLLVITQHHLITDGWSLGLFFGEMASLYNAFRQDGNPPEPETNLSYADFATWQNANLEGMHWQRNFDYWLNQLHQATRTRDLPTDFPRPPVMTYGAERHEMALPAELTQSLEALCRAEGVTPYMVLLATFQVLAARYSGSDQVLIGSPMANRTRRELTDVIGFFVNMVPIFADLSDQPSFRDFLKTTRKTVLEAHAHQDIPFEALLEKLSPERDLGRTPLYQVVFGTENDPARPPQLQGLEVRSKPIDSGMVAYDLVVHLEESEGVWRGHIRYNRGLFLASRISRMAEHYQTLLKAFTSNPSLRVDRADLLTGEQTASLLSTWARSIHPYPTQATIHETIERLAVERPDAPALVFGSKTLSYRDMNAHANAIANDLLAKGCQRGEYVAVSVRRNLYLPCALLGILKAGAAYFPVDPAYPEAHCRFLFEEGGVRTILVEAASRETFANLGVGLIRYDEPEVEAMANPNLPCTSADAAYLLFTSGSTGRAKGVTTSHGNVIQLAKGLPSANLGSDTTTLLLAPLSFDAATFEIWGALLNGGRCVIFPEERPTAKSLAAAIRNHRVNTMWLTSALFNTVIDEDPHALASLEKLLIGGEALSPRHVQKALGTMPDTDIINGYGPTETTVFACNHTIREAGSAIPIGKPIGTSQVLVLDRRLQTVPIGVDGELFIGGDGLARGYHRRPSLTAQRFIPNPFATANQSGSRLYRTGDLVRWREDGCLAFLGRTDFQVKIRGYRIEPGHIESVLKTAPGIRDAVVVSRQNPQRETYLAAYILAESQDPARVTGARDHLRSHLPSYMVPGVITCLAEFPLTPNGKVDRAALPRPEQNHGQRKQHRAPATPREKTIAGVWMALLDLVQVDADANFFEVGGHSLTATRLINRLSELWHLRLPLVLAFEAPTVASLAAAIDKIDREKRGFEVPTPQRLPQTDVFPLSHATQRLLFTFQIMPQSALYNVPRAIRLKGGLNVPLLQTALDHLVQGHDVLHARYGHRGKHGCQILVPGFELKLQVRDANEAEAFKLAHQAAERPFDLEHEVPVRAYLWRIASDDHLLLLNLHHIATDGHSLELLDRQLAEAYQRLERGLPLTDVTPRLRYGDFAAWQRTWLNDHKMASQLDYWTDRLANLTNLELPTDRPRPTPANFRSGRCSFELGESLSNKVLDLSRQQRTTAFMTLMAAFQVLLFRYSGQADIAVGSPVANRPHSDLQNIAGFFANMLVMRGFPQGDQPFRVFLEQIRETALEAYAHQDVPFAKLVEILQPDRDLSRNPLFQVTFSVQHEGDVSTLWQSPKASSVFIDPGACQFDLHLALTQTASGFRGGIRYATALFDQCTVEKMMARLRTLIEAIVENPDTSLDDLPLEAMSGLEAEDARYNRTRADYPGNRTLGELFQAVVTRMPQAIAVRFGGESLSYAALEKRANRLANHLLASGFRPGSPVAIATSRSSWMITGILAILKAGGYYVPLDPDQPGERLAFIVADTGTGWMLTESKLTLPDFGTRQVIVDRLPQEIPSENPRIDIGPEAPAYIIYTSGSTGRPKGVMVSQRSVSRLVFGANYLDYGPDQVIAQVANPMFDAATFEIWGALLHGARLEGFTKEECLSPERFTRALKARQISAIFLTTALFNQISREMPGELQSVTQLMVGGEKLDPPAIRRVLEHGAPPKLINIYGPTENTSFSTHYLIEKVDDTALGIPLGYPVSNSTTHIMDSALRLVPIGIPGELVLGGDGVAIGYWNRPALTASRFVPNPLNPHPGARLYRSGDLAQRAHSGEILYHGRMDFQVKLRGHRIELGEIEHALTTHEDILETVVVLDRAHSDLARLIAYLIPSGDKTPSPRTLRAFLANRLPEYMIPSAFVCLDDFPLSSNGKVDRKALPLPEAVAKTYRSPETETERELAEIWADLLRLKTVGADDHFFEIGGHSLVATQLALAIQEHFGVRLPLRRIFESPQLGAMAATIEQLQIHEADGLEDLLSQLEGLSDADAEQMLEPTPNPTRPV